MRAAWRAGIAATRFASASAPTAMSVIVSVASAATKPRPITASWYPKKVRREGRYHSAPAEASAPIILRTRILLRAVI